MEVLHEPSEGEPGAAFGCASGLPGTDVDDLEEQADAVADFMDELLVKMDIDAVAEPNAGRAQCTWTSSTAPRTTWRS